MQTQLPQLPPAPTQPEEPQKKRLPRWLIIVGAVVVSLGIISAVAPKTNSATGKAATAAADTACFDVDAAQVYVSDAISELEDGTTDVQNFDVASAADHEDAAADDFGQVAVLAADYPTLASPAQSASTHMGQAADALRSGDFDQSLTYMNLATDDINRVSSATEALIGVAVPC